MQEIVYGIDSILLEPLHLIDDNQAVLAPALDFMCQLFQAVFVRIRGRRNPQPCAFESVGEVQLDTFSRVVLIQRQPGRKIAPFPFEVKNLGEQGCLAESAGGPQNHDGATGSFDAFDQLRTIDIERHPRGAP